MLSDPIAQFRETLARAREREPSDATACALATADGEGRPSARVVLLKGADESGFVFYTNYESRKARQLAANPWAALCFYWPTIDEQVRVEGRVERLSAADSDAYFASRPRTSQLGAWASAQSQPLTSRLALLRRVVQLERRFLGGAVTRPPHWGGYRLTPERIEFWRAGSFRLHDRFLYERRGDGWRKERLFP